MSLNTTKIIYCGKKFDDFHTNYKLIHGYVSLSVCILGTLANSLNIIVLTRREMRTPTNAILTGLAVADLAVMLEYIPYALHDYVLSDQWPREQQLNYQWACYIKFHAIYAQVLHTISIWLTVMLAVWRYIAVTYPQASREWCGMRNTVLSIMLAYVMCGIVVTPWLYFVSSVAEFQEIVSGEDRVIESNPLSEYIVNYQAKHDYANYSKPSILNRNASIGNGYNSNIRATSTTTAAPAQNHEVGKNSTALPLLPNKHQPEEVHRNITVYRLYHSDLALQNNTIRVGTLLIYSVLIKLIPCIALTILSLRLISALLEVKRRRQMLRSQLIRAEEKSYADAAATATSQLLPTSVMAAPTTVTGVTTLTVVPEHAATSTSPLAPPQISMEQSTPVSSAGCCGENSLKTSFLIRKKIDKAKQTDRTTQMLLAVLLLFLITEFPQGIMGLLNMLLGEAFFMQCYLKLSDLMDTLALLNSSINFILYCSMSRQFRQTFVFLFCPRYLSRCFLSHHHLHHLHHHHHHHHHHSHQGVQNNLNQYYQYESELQKNCIEQDQQTEVKMNTQPRKQKKHKNKKKCNKLQSHQQYRQYHQHHQHHRHQQISIQEDNNLTVLNGLLTNDNRSKSAFITEQWYEPQTTTQVTHV